MLRAKLEELDPPKDSRSEERLLEIRKVLDLDGLTAAETVEQIDRIMRVF